MNIYNTELNRNPKQMYLYHPRGKRDLGRSRKRLLEARTGQSAEDDSKLGMQFKQSHFGHFRLNSNINQYHDVQSQEIWFIQ
jgi:hypothetical protein